MCSIIIFSRTNSLAEILEVLGGLSEDFKLRELDGVSLECQLMGKVKFKLRDEVQRLVQEISSFNSTKVTLIDELKSGKVTSDRQTEILQSIYVHKLKVKGLVAFNDNYRKDNVTQVIKDFNDFFNCV